MQKIKQKTVQLDLKDLSKSIPAILRLMLNNHWGNVAILVDKLKEMHPGDSNVMGLGFLYEEFKVSGSQMANIQNFINTLEQSKADDKNHMELWGKIINRLINSEQLVNEMDVPRRKYAKADLESHAILRMLTLQGSSFLKAEQWDKAIKKLELVISKVDDCFEALLFLGQAMFCYGNHSLAKKHFERAKELNLNSEAVYMFLGCIAHAANEFEDANKFFLKAWRLNNKSYKNAKNMAVILYEHHKLTEAITFFEKALKMDDANSLDKLSYAMMQLMSGDFEHGLINYESRLLLKDNHRLYKLLQKHPKAKWRGEPVKDKKVLLIAEQGLGDTIFASRYISQLLSKGAKVHLSASDSLHKLMKMSFPDISVSDTFEALKCNFISPIMSLPYRLGIKVDNVPNKTPYLKVDDSIVSKWGDIIKSSKFKIGVVWFGGEKFQYDKQRSMKLAQMQPLFGQEQAQWYSLQIGGGDEIKQLGLEHKIINLESNLSDFAETAGAMAHLDLVICVDTAVVHLAGALGKPVWMFNRFIPDWRWGLQGEKNAWYPTMKIFRQSSDRIWDPVIQNVRDNLDPHIVAMHKHSQ